MIAVVFLGPSAERYIIDVRQHVQRGTPIDVPEALAGREPTRDDPGAGLLAQVDTWARLGTPAATAAIQRERDHFQRQVDEGIDPGPRLAAFLAATSLTLDDSPQVITSGAEREE